MWRSGLGFFDMRAERNQQDKTILFPGIGAYQWRSAESRLIWTEELARLYGLDALPDGVGFDAFVHPEDRQEVVTGTYALLTAGGSYAREFRIVRPDGEVRHIHDRGVVERGKDRSPILKGVHIDVTPHRRPGPARPRRDRFPRGRGVAAPDGLDLRFFRRLRLSQPPVAAYTGAPESEQLGYGWLDRLHPEDRDAPWRIGANGREGPQLRDRVPHPASRRGVSLVSNTRRPLARLVGTDPQMVRQQHGYRGSQAGRGGLAGERGLRPRPRAGDRDAVQRRPDRLVLFDRDFRFVRVNERLAEISPASRRNHRQAHGGGPFRRRGRHVARRRAPSQRGRGGRGTWRSRPSIPRPGGRGPMS